MRYYNNYYWGMNVFWWLIWIVILIWIFATPWDIPGQRKRKDTAFDILNRRLTNGEITKEEFEEKKKILQQT
jgi:putative membrane protein